MGALQWRHHLPRSSGRLCALLQHMSSVSEAGRGSSSWELNLNGAHHKTGCRFVEAVGQEVVLHRARGRSGAGQDQPSRSCRSTLRRP